MTLDLARDALHYTPAQLSALRAQVRTGDLTPIMELYEQDIRAPLRTALTGTLVRNVFIQVQKAKVDIDQALAPIDKLQEPEARSLLRTQGRAFCVSCAVLDLFPA